MTNVEVRGDLERYEIGQPRAVWSARGDRILRYSMDVRHKVLHLHRELSAPETFILESKVNALIANWDEKYESSRLKTIFRDGKTAADEATADAQRKIRELSRILSHTLTVNDAVDWESLKDTRPYDRPSAYPEPKPIKSIHPVPSYGPPDISFFDLLFGRKRALIEQAEARHAQAVADSERRNSEAGIRFKQELSDWQKREESFWNEQALREDELKKEQAARNQVVEDLKQGVQARRSGFNRRARDADSRELEL